MKKINNNWQEKPFWKLTTKKSINDQDHLELLSVYLNKGVIKFSDIKQKRTNVTSEDKSKYQRVDSGDLVMNNQQSWRGSVGISKMTGIVSPAYLVFCISEELNPAFAHYLFRDKYMVDQYILSSRGVGSIQRNLHYPSLRDIKVPVPPKEEQELIAKYLEKKSKQITSLIEKIDRKIKLYEEQKSALINQYLTKGLELNVEMIDTGIDWIGEIPKHWKITKLKYLSKINVQYGLNIESDFYCESGIRFLRITDIKHDGSLKKDGGVYLNESNVPCEYILKKGDLLFSRTGGTVGKSTLIESSEELMSFAGYLVRFSFESFDLSVFVNLFSKSSAFWYWINLQITQSTIQNVNGEKYSNLVIPLPPVNEIKEINSKLKKKLTIFDQIIQKEYIRKNYLIEYRQSLISSVVTGKIRITEDMI